MPPPSPCDGLNWCRPGECETHHGIGCEAIIEPPANPTVPGWSWLPITQDRRSCDCCRHEATPNPARLVDRYRLLRGLEHRRIGERDVRWHGLARAQIKGGGLALRRHCAHRRRDQHQIETGPSAGMRLSAPPSRLRRKAGQGRGQIIAGEVEAARMPVAARLQLKSYRGMANVKLIDGEGGSGADVCGGKGRAPVRAELLAASAASAA